VSDIAAGLAERLGLDSKRVMQIHRAGMLHDMGKIWVPDAVLWNKHHLSRNEIRLMREHCTAGANLLLQLHDLKFEARIALLHHEWWNGQGYPFGIRRLKIPYEARLVHIADSLDAMLTSRRYKEAYSFERACDELVQAAGSQFDPLLAKVAVRWMSSGRMRDVARAA
jgi:HD-GYP domain-containing protein (c-di-GMP phosphodiesterase class II)